jgi:hypothetical protein
MIRASGDPAARAAARLIGATLAPMATTEEKLIDEAVSLLSPLAGAALEAVVDVVRLLVTHKDGAELAAKRQAQALAAEAFIRS